jgi:hypothetical protein
MCRDTRQGAHRVGVSLRSPPSHTTVHAASRTAVLALLRQSAASLGSIAVSPANHMQAPLLPSWLPASPALAGRLTVASDFCSDHSETTRDFPLSTGSALRHRHQPRLLWPLLTCGAPSQHHSMPIAQGRVPDLPGYCAPTFTLMRVGYVTTLRTGIGLSIFGLLSPRCSLYPLPVRRAGALRTAHFRLPVNRGTVAFR